MKSSIFQITNHRLYESHWRIPRFIILFIGIIASTFLEATENISSQEAAYTVSLLSDALRARATGDVEAARKILLELEKSSPGDPTVARLIASLSESPGPPVAPTNTEDDGHGQPLTETSRFDQRTAETNQHSGAFPSDETSDDHSAAFRIQQERISTLLTMGADRLSVGDYQGAAEISAEITAIDPLNTDAKQLHERIVEARKALSQSDRNRTKSEMLAEVAQSWQRPRVLERESESHPVTEDRGLRDRIDRIHIPRVSFGGIPLSRVLETLSLLSEEHDPDGIGVNIVHITPDGDDPSVHITLRQLPLHRILDFIVESVGYEYDVQHDVIVVRRGTGEGVRLETEFFPITRSTIIRLTGLGSAAESLQQSFDPFAPASPASSQEPSQSTEEIALKSFLQRAGVPFDSVPGANLALADGQIIVTQTSRNMERVRNILRRYSEVKQVEIESRFLEVQQGDLEELGFQWLLQAGGRPVYDGTGNPILEPDGSVLQSFRRQFQSYNRTLDQTFRPSAHGGEIQITGSPGEVGNAGRFSTPVGPPQLPSAIPLGSDAGYLAAITGVIGGAEVDVLVRALSRSQGSDLMSAPKITVLSGKTAQIVVAQELRYPENYGDVRAQVGRGDSASGSAGVAITSGTPLDFTMRNIGVEMEVTPTVEDDNSISLLLEPKVTEFEGFVEYGGPNIAIASNRTVTIPSGFFQPIFSVRRVRTEVTIWDGATVVMGGLTREQAVTIEDKVPVLGSIPLLGRLFRSEAESTQKRNLLIFVTANLVSPGGSPMRQHVQSVPPGSLYQNPSFVTPGGTLIRSSSE